MLKKNNNNSYYYYNYYYHVPYLSISLLYFITKTDFLKLYDLFGKISRDIKVRNLMSNGFSNETR